MKAIGYVRVSTLDQAEGVSLDAQEAKIRAWAKQHGAEDVAIFRDEGISGSRADRPGLLAALDSLERDCCLVVTKLDRIARDAFLSCWVEKEVKKAKARVVSLAGEGADGEDDDPTKTLLRRISTAFAEYERLIIGQRTKAALRYKKANGEKTGGDVPFGYRARNGKLYRDAQEQKAVRFILELHGKGQSLRAIGRALEEANISRKQGSPSWHPQAVQRVIERERNGQAHD